MFMLHAANETPTSERSHNALQIVYYKSDHMRSFQDRDRFVICVLKICDPSRISSAFIEGENKFRMH